MFEWLWIILDCFFWVVVGLHQATSSTSVAESAMQPHTAKQQTTAEQKPQPIKAEKSKVKQQPGTQQVQTKAEPKTIKVKAEKVPGQHSPTAPARAPEMPTEQPRNELQPPAETTATTAVNPKMEMSKLSQKVKQEPVDTRGIHEESMGIMGNSWGIDRMKLNETSIK